MPLLSKPAFWSTPARYSLLLAVSLLYYILRLDRPGLSIPKSLRTIAGAGLNLDILRKLFPFLFPKSGPYKTYRTLDEEDDYWESAEIGQRELSFSDARYSKCSFDESSHARERQILYYTPRLLPEYRSKRSNRDNVDTIPTRAFVKWHCLVFPDSVRYAFVSVLDTNLTVGSYR